MKPRIFKFIAAVLCLLAVPFASLADGSQPTPPWAVLVPKGGVRPRTPVIEITCYALNGLMWFEYDSAAEGCLDITVTHRASGNSISVCVCDDTPFTIPYTGGTLDVSCFTEAGEEYTGTIQL